jgi:hypothetical protein
MGASISGPPSRNDVSLSSCISGIQYAKEGRPTHNTVMDGETRETRGDKRPNGQTANQAKHRAPTSEIRK